MSTNDKPSTFGWREICRCCCRPSPVGFLVPDEIWNLSVPQVYSSDPLRDRPLCIVCFAMFADEAGIEWDRDIEFFPVSLVSHFRIAEEHG